MQAVADAQDRQISSQDLRRRQGRTRLIDTVRATGKDKASRVQSAYALPRGAWRQQLAIDIAFADAPRDQPGVLATEIENDDGLTVGRGGGGHQAPEMGKSLLPTVYV